MKDRTKYPGFATNKIIPGILSKAHLNIFVAKPGYFVAPLYKLWHPQNIPWNFKMIVTQNIKLDREGDGMTCETINKTCGKNNIIFEIWNIN